MENVAREQGLALQLLFLYKSSNSFKNSGSHKFSFFMGASNLAIWVF